MCPSLAVAVGRAATVDSVPRAADFMRSEVEMISLSHCLTVHQSLHSKADSSQNRTDSFSRVQNSCLTHCIGYFIILKYI